MTMYEQLYHMLFTSITNALDRMDPDSPEAFILRQAQIDAEELYISWEE